MIVGAIASTAGMALLALSVAQKALLTFFLATATSGWIQPLAGVLSAVYLLTYLSLGVAAPVLGIVATRQV